jgi:hypothetical protein
MKAEKLVQHLSEAARRLGFKVRTEEGNFEGGSCVFAAERIVFLNRRDTHEERAELLGRLLAGENVEELFLLPEVRAYVERFAVDPLRTAEQKNGEP